MFARLYGNSHTADQLRRFLSSGRVPNSLLFAGIEGIGKRQFALELAKSLVCQDPRERESCGECPACRRADVFVFPGDAAKGEDYDRVFFSEHPDVGTVIPFNRTLRVGSIRQLEAEANFRPFEASCRAFIIDDADKMNDSSSNALLKTLEEPPPTSHLFLITSKPDSLLATIRSRCQVLRFAPVEAGEIEKMLLSQHQYSQEDARMVAAVSRGSIARAIGVNVDDFRQRREAALGILRDAMISRDLSCLMRSTELVSDPKNKSAFEDLLDLLESLIRDAWSIARSTDAPANADVLDELKVLSRSADPGRLAGLVEYIEAMRESLAVNINKKVAMDALLVKLASA